MYKEDDLNNHQEIHQQKTPEKTEGFFQRGQNFRLRSSQSRYTTYLFKSAQIENSQHCCCLIAGGVDPTKY